MEERMYTVNETFEVLKKNKITSNIESVRRWLRDGTIKGIAPVSRKEGWKVTQAALDAFLAERLPNTSNIVNETTLKEVAKLHEQLDAVTSQLQRSRDNEIRIMNDLLHRLDMYNQLHEQLLFERELKVDEEAVRAAMWYEMARKNIWEGFVEVKKSMLKEAAEHRGYSQQLVNEVWERCVANSAAYKQPRVSYLLDAFSFEGERLLLEQAFSSKAEQVVYAIFEHIKRKQTNDKN